MRHRIGRGKTGQTQNPLIHRSQRHHRLTPRLSNADRDFDALARADAFGGGDGHLKPARRGIKPDPGQAKRAAGAAFARLTRAIGGDGDIGARPPGGIHRHFDIRARFTQRDFAERDKPIRQHRNRRRPRKGRRDAQPRDFSGRKIAAFSGNINPVRNFRTFHTSPAGAEAIGCHAKPIRISNFQPIATKGQAAREARGRGGIDSDISCIHRFIAPDCFETSDGIAHHQPPIRPFTHKTKPEPRWCCAAIGCDGGDFKGCFRAGIHRIALKGRAQHRKQACGAHRHGNLRAAFAPAGLRNRQRDIGLDGQRCIRCAR